MIRAAYGKPGDGMTYVEADQLSTPSARPGLRLLCLLVQTRNGETRSLPVHTLRPMPPRLCAADSHAANGLRRWNLEASGLGVDSGTGLYLREAHATRPPREVVERYLRLGQANALRSDSRTVRAGGLRPTAPAEAEQVQGRAPGSSDHASPIRRTEARAERTLDPARTETASARECGAASPPRAPEPSAARVG
jgi:hypothetical protein